MVISYAAARCACLPCSNTTASLSQAATLDHLFSMQQAKVLGPENCRSPWISKTKGWRCRDNRKISYKLEVTSRVNTDSVVEWSSIRLSGSEVHRLCEVFSNFAVVACGSNVAYASKSLGFCRRYHQSDTMFHGFAYACKPCISQR